MVSSMAISGLSRLKRGLFWWFKAPKRGCVRDTARWEELEPPQVAVSER